MSKHQSKHISKQQPTKHFFNTQYRSQRVNLPAQTHTYQNSQAFQQSLKNKTLDDKKLAEYLQRHQQQLRQTNQSENELAEQISRERVSTDNDGISKKQKYLELALESCLQENKTLHADRQHLEKQLKSLRRQFQRSIQQKQEECNELTQKVKIMQKDDRDKRMKYDKKPQLQPNLQAEAQVKILRERLIEIKETHHNEIKNKQKIVKELNSKIKSLQKINASLELELDHLKKGAKSQLKKIRKTALSELKKSQKQNLSLTQKIEKIEKSLSYHQSVVKDHLEEEDHDIQRSPVCVRPASAKQNNSKKQQKNESTLVTNFYTQTESNNQTRKQIKSNIQVSFSRQIQLEMNRCWNALEMQKKIKVAKKGGRIEENMIEFLRELYEQIIERKQRLDSLQENRKEMRERVEDLQSKIKKGEEKMCLFQNQNSSLLRCVNNISEESKRQKVSFQQTYQLMTERIKIIQNKFAGQYKHRLFQILQKTLNQQQNISEFPRLEFAIERFIEHVTNSSHRQALFSISQKRNCSLQNEIKKLKSKSKSQLNSSANAMNTFDEQLMIKYANNITQQAIIQKQHEELKLREEKGKQIESKIEKQGMLINKLEEENLLLKKERLKTAIKYEQQMIRRQQFAQNVEYKINRIDKILLKQISTQTEFNTPLEMTYRETSFRNLCQF